MIDALVGTDIRNCGGCKKRQECLNSLVPRLPRPCGRWPRADCLLFPAWHNGHMATSTSNPVVSKEPPITLSRYKRTPVMFDNGVVEIVTTRTAAFPHDDSITNQLA